MKQLLQQIMCILQLRAVPGLRSKKLNIRSGVNLDIETRYRRGIFLPPQENHLLIYNRVSAINSKLQRIDANVDEYKKSIMQFETYEKEVVEAKRLLKVSNDFNGDLLKITEKLIAENPEKESALWKAMWDLKKFQKRKAEHEKVLRRYADELEHRQHHVDLGWPIQWPDLFCKLWLELGGSPKSASAWANAGWWPEAVLLQDVYSSNKKMTIAERLLCITPPPMLKIVDDATDCPDIEESDVVA